MLYSISVNLPAHRANQLDRVLVVASPINDINLHAWDINKVKRFIELDIGIRMELCHSCYRGRSMTTTFILEKQFVKDCIAFLCKQAQISDPPIVENGLFIYTVAHHKCSTSVQDVDALTERDEVPEVNEPPPIPPRLPKKSSEVLNSKSMEKSNSAVHVCINNSNDLTTTDDNRRSRCFTTTSVDVTFNKEQTIESKPVKPVIAIPEYWDDYTGSDSWTGGTGTESLFMADGSLTKTDQDPPKDTKSNPCVLPPRTVPRKNHESSIPAAKQPYYNYQPHLFNHGDNKCFDAPYQISSRIIIKDSGEVQFERNIMGNQPPKRHGGFHFKQQIPIPPRGLRANTDLRGNVVVGGNKDGNNPSLQTNFNFQSSAATNLTATGSQFSHEVSTNMNTTVNVGAPPIPPRPSRKSSGGSSVNSSRSTCKSPVPLPRSNISSSGIKKSSMESESFIENEAYCKHFISAGDPRLASHLASLPQPKTFPLLPHHGITFGPNRTDGDSELESHSHKRDGQSLGSMKSDLTDESDAYVVPNTPPLGYSRSNSRNTLSPSYVDESQFILETSSPDYLKLVAMKKEASDGQTITSETHAEPPGLQEEHRNGSLNFHDKSAELLSGNEHSLEPDDKECDFEDAASIAFIQTSYRQRCASSSSTPHNAIESSTSLFSSYCMQISLENVKQGQAKPEVPPRKLNKAKEPEQQGKYENTSLTSSQETQSEVTMSCTTCSTSSVTSDSDQSLLDLQSRETNHNETAKLTKPLPRPRSKNKIVLSKSLNVYSSSDSNLLESINDSRSETNWSIKAGQKSTSLSTRFFLDDAGIGVSEL